MKILITGITGLLGTALVQKNQKRRRIEGIYVGNYKASNSEMIKYYICNVANKDRLFKLFRNNVIDCIIHAGGLANTDICERNPKLAYISNVEGTNNIIELAQRKNAKLVYISTNAVFDGEKAPYTEEDKPNPINRYGKIKLECESLIKKKIVNHLIIRPILMYGLSNPHERKCFLIWILEKLENREKINIVTDVFENPLLSYQCAHIIWKLIDKDAQGIYHIAGKDIHCRYEAAKTIAKVFSLDDTTINPVTSDFFPNIAPRPKNTSFSTAKIEKELDIKLLGFNEGLIFLRNEYLFEKKIHQ